MFCKAGLWLFPVFVLFRPVIDGKASRPKRRRPRAFPLFVRGLTETEKRQVVGRPPVFLLLFTGKYRAAGAAGPRSHVADAAVHHYLYAVSAGRG
jgi:hypothetical protein